jgi:methyl-accepting chemotaxis protein
MRRTRRRLFPIIYRSFQYRFLAMILIYNSIIVAFISLSVFIPDVLQMIDENQIFEVRAAAADKFLLSHSQVWPALIAIMFLILLHSFRFFHRFVGPLYRFRMAFERMRDGDLGFRIRIRKHDFLHEEKQSINEMIEGFTEKIGSIQQASNNSLNALNELREMLNQPGKNWKDSKELLLTLSQNLDTVADAARYFRLETSEQDSLGSET